MIQLSPASPLRPVIDSLRQGLPCLRLSALAGSAPAFLASLIIAELKRPVLVISSEADSARKVKDELDFFLEAWAASARTALLPERDCYRPLSLDPGGSRPAALAALALSSPDRPAAVSASLPAVLTRTPAAEYFYENLFQLRPGFSLDRDEFLAQMVRSGYSPVSAVMEPGDFSSRGGIVDVFPPGEEGPLRIEFWGDEIRSLRTFDVVSQKSRAELSEAAVGPFKEVILDPGEAEKAVAFLDQVMSRFKEGKEPGVEAVSLLRTFGEICARLERQDHFPGIESFLPAFYPEASVLDYLPGDAVILYLEPFLAEQAAARTWSVLEKEWHAEVAAGRFALPPRHHFVSRRTAEKVLAHCTVVVCGAAASGPLMVPAESEGEDDHSQDVLGPLPLSLENALDLPGINLDASGLRAQAGEEEPLAPLRQALVQFRQRGVRTLLVAPAPGKADRWRELLAGTEAGEPVPAGARGVLMAREPLVQTVGPIQRGFVDLAGGLAVIPETEIFGEKIRPRRKTAPALSSLTEFLELSEGDHVVHEDHGIGIFRGLESLAVQWPGEWDFVNLRERPRIRVDAAKIEYAGGAILFVPVHRVNQISKYTGPGESPPELDTLGGTAWERYKRRAAKAVREFAEQLLKLYAARQAHRGIVFPPPDRTFREFEESFEYEETEDQIQAIEDVLADMQKDRPMDRVVCGDVGYGKTEVALRAAFLAAMAGRQVAVLVPTTILAQQHYETFSRRLALYPLVVKVLSRFLSPREQKEVLAGLRAGTVDIVIGTHRLLSRDVVFNDLGLLVIDEEHRFGVRHKERLREIRATVDTLTLTATPIPRTLYMAMTGLRDLSIINTPPPDRLSVHTELIRPDEAVIRETIERELRRGGQVFFVHNRVQTIEAAANRVRRLVPYARLAVAHGQMGEKDLEETMREFVQGRIDILICSAIIESGLDIPRVNTMIIDHADQFGLAQLYQLRGRIGRSRQRGYCYLLVPAKGVLTREAAHRLRVIKEFSELGSGFRVAAHDLEIRGAGNLLGPEQSGHIYRIGLELYLRLLEQEIQRQKGEVVEVEIEPEIKLPVSAYLPEEYVPDAAQRLAWYKRLSRVRSETQLAALQEELMDRYGPLLPPAENLVAVARIKSQLYRLHALELAYTGTELCLALAEHTPLPVERIIALAERDPCTYRLAPDNRIFRRTVVKKPEELFAAIAAFLKELGGDDRIFFTAGGEQISAREPDAEERKAGNP